MRTLYTWHTADYMNTRYAHPQESIRIFWVTDKGTPIEGSGSTDVQACGVQSEIHRLESSGHIVESITGV